MLLDCLNFSLSQIDTLSNLLTSRYLQCWDGVEIALDETCQPHNKPTEDEQRKAVNSGEPIPHHFIKRKPHPNCILSWMVGSKSTMTNLSFIYGLFHDVTRPKLTGGMALGIPHFCFSLFSYSREIFVYVGSSTETNDSPFYCR